MVVWIFCRRASGWFGVGDLLDDRAVVAEDDVVVGDLERCLHGRDAGADRVQVAPDHVRVGRDHRPADGGQGRQFGALAVDHVVAGQHVVTVECRGGGERVVARLDRRVLAGHGHVRDRPRVERRGRAVVDELDGQPAREDVDVDAAVAVDVVGAAQTEDRVVARAAGEVVAGLAADDQVVALAAVGREADRRQVAARRVAGDPREQAAGVDDVVAGEVVRVGEREQPLVVLVLRLGDLVERVERLGPELVALDAERLARSTRRRPAMCRRRRRAASSGPAICSVPLAPRHGSSASGDRLHTVIRSPPTRVPPSRSAS